MKTKVNEVPLVGPKGRKELLKRINELEAQVAKQDYIIVNLIGVLDDTTDAFNEEITRQLANYIEAGVIFDVILQDPNGNRTRIGEHSQVDASGRFTIVAWSVGEHQFFQYNLSLQSVTPGGTISA